MDKASWLAKAKQPMLLLAATRWLGAARLASKHVSGQRQGKSKAGKLTAQADAGQGNKGGKAKRHGSNATNLTTTKGKARTKARRRRPG